MHLVHLRITSLSASSYSRPNSESPYVNFPILFLILITALKHSPSKKGKRESVSKKVSIAAAAAAGFATAGSKAATPALTTLAESPAAGLPTAGKRGEIVPGPTSVGVVGATTSSSEQESGAATSASQGELHGAKKTATLQPGCEAGFGPEGLKKLGPLSARGN